MMKKITLFFVMLLLSFTGYAQLEENFEGTTLPNTTTGDWVLTSGTWKVFDNGVGLAQSWTASTATLSACNGRSAYLNRENVAAGTFAEDWLVTPLVTVPTNGQLRFSTKQTLAANFGSIYTIRVSTTSQTDPTSFTTIQTWDETDLNAVFDQCEEKVVSLSGYTGQIYIAFVMTNDNGDRWIVDDVKVVEQCLDPTAQTASNPTLTGATLGWTSPGSASQWEVEIVATGATPTGTGVVVTSNSYTATGLTDGTCYDFYVRALCTSGPIPTNSEWIGPFNFCTAAFGENCSAPIVIPPNTFPYVTTDDTSGFGDDVSGSPGAGCGTTQPYLNGDDVFYQFTSTTGTPVTITSQTTTTFSGLFVYSDCANVGVSCVAGTANGNPNTNTPDNLVFTPTIGVTYYIVISTSPNPQSTPYTLTITENTCTNLTASYAVLTNCPSGTDTFFVTANVTNMGTATSISGTTVPASTTETITAPGVMQFGPFPNNTPVTINLQNDQDDNCFRNSSVLTQTFCPAPNNLCADAIALNCNTTVSGTTQGSTAVGAPTTTCGTTSNTSPGVWYTFLGNGDVTTFSLCGSAFDTKMQILTGTCGAFTCVAGNDNSCGTQSEIQIATTVGTLYYIYVYGVNNTTSGTFVLNTTCITPPPPPANDNCDTATVAPVNTDGSCTQVTPGTVAGATPSSQANACAGSADDDVWFSFTATQATHTITLQNIVGSTLDLNHVVYTSTNATDPCGNLTQVLCSNPNFSLLNGLVAGQVYFIRVYTATAALLQDTTFNLCISVPPPPPSNDSCATPLNVHVNAANTCAVFTSGTISSATASPEPNTCGGTDDDDVWFEFTATNASHIISLNNIVGTTTDLAFVLYSGGSCGSLTQISCNLTGNGTINNLVPGTTYKLRVYSDTATPGQFADFDVCVGSPPISVNNTQYTVQQLVTDVLVNSPCAQISNITWKTGNTNGFGSTNGIAYFQENAPGVLPFSNGIIMSTGDAMKSSGPNNQTIGDGNTNWTGDADLENVINNSSLPITLISRNATVIEFDFVPLIGQISFSYFFASEEYGTFQCTYTDSFAFLLTNTTTGVTTNLAIVPSTVTPNPNTPISVLTVRDQVYNPNGSCNSINEQYFDIYSDPFNPVYASIPSEQAPTQYNGQTVEFVAQSAVTPLDTYHIKMVIADNLDSNFDSAVFLKANSFNIGNVELGNDFLESNGNALCEGETYTILSGLNPADYTFEWSNSLGVIQGETGPNLTVTEEGVYSISAQLNGTTCAATDSITIEFYDPFVIGMANNLIDCNPTGFATFDLSQNLAPILDLLNPADYTVSYYSTQSDANNEVNPILTPDNYTNVIQYLETVFVRVENNNDGCYQTTTFNLIIQDLTPQFTLTPDFSICQNETGTITVTPINFADTDVTYTWTLGTNPLPDTTNSITVSQAGTYTVEVDNNGCTATLSTIVTVLPSPAAPTITSNSPICSGLDAIFTVTGSPNAVVSYSIDGGTTTDVTLDSSGVGIITQVGATSDVLLTLSNINDGTCNSLLTDTATVVIIAAPNEPVITANGPICSGSDAIFTVVGSSNATINYTLNGGASQVLNLDSAGSGTITLNGATSDVNVILTEINDGTCSAVISTTSTITVNSIPSVTSVTSNDQICTNNDAIFNIVGTPNSTVTYTLNGGSNETVTLDSSGNSTIVINSVSTTQTIVLSAVSLNGCTDFSLNNTASVIIIPDPIADDISDSFICAGGSYTFPLPLSSGNAFYTSSGGVGLIDTTVTPSVVINATTTFYVYVSNGSCFDEESFTVTAIDSPVVVLEGGCEGSSYTINASVVGGQAVTYKWFDSNGEQIPNQTGSSIEVSQDGTYSCVVTLTTGNQCESEEVFFIADGTLCTIQKGISPNGDGLNENFDLTGLNVRKLEIFNRYGKKVYSFSNYTNQWYGQTDNGNELPSGTYYYVIERDNVEAQSGWIYINR